MGDTKFSVSWQAYQKNICNGLSFLQQRGELVDMTLAADGHLVQVHRLVLSLVSPFIKELIASALCSHPVLFIHKVSYESLQLILEYAYTGEVVVASDRLDNFLEACTALQIRGLENMAKPIHTPVDFEGSIQIKNNTTEEYESDSDIPHRDSPLLQEQLMQSHDFGANMEVENNETRDHNLELTIKKKDSKRIQAENKILYTLSAKGSVQLILNRYIYTLRNIRKDDKRWWRCFNHKSHCNALLLTDGEQILYRKGAHNHPFHDKQILKRVKKNNVFQTEPKKHHLQIKNLIEDSETLPDLQDAVILKVVEKTEIN